MRPKSQSNERVLIGALTPDPEFAEAMRATFGAASQIDLDLVTGSLSENADKLDFRGAGIVIVDLDDARNPKWWRCSG